MGIQTRRNARISPPVLFAKRFQKDTILRKTTSSKKWNIKKRHEVGMKRLTTQKKMNGKLFGCPQIENFLHFLLWWLKQNISAYSSMMRNPMGRCAAFNFLFGLWSWTKDLVKCLGPQQTYYHQWCQEVWRGEKELDMNKTSPFHTHKESQNALGCLLAYVGWRFATFCFHTTCLNHLLPNGLVGSNTIFLNQNSHILSISQIPPKIRTSGSWTSTTPKHCNPNYPHFCVSRAKNDVFPLRFVNKWLGEKGWSNDHSKMLLMARTQYIQCHVYSISLYIYIYIYFLYISI